MFSVECYAEKGEGRADRNQLITVKEGGVLVAPKILVARAIRATSRSFMGPPGDQLSVKL
jgi:hypothetical protein